MKSIWLVAVLALVGCDRPEATSKTAKTPTPPPSQEQDAPQKVTYVEPDEPEMVAVWGVDCFSHGTRIWTGKVNSPDAGSITDFVDELTGKRIQINGEHTCVWTFLLERPAK